MRRVYALLERVKDADVPVLITGESGTGKEGRCSARSTEALPAGIVRSSGSIAEPSRNPCSRASCSGTHEARSPARIANEKGLFREAHGGTLLLDEIGEMPQRMQTSLLRVLQDRKVRPVGGTEEQLVDVRLIFATHRDLESMVKAGSFS